MRTCSPTLILDTILDLYSVEPVRPAHLNGGTPARSFPSPPPLPIVLRIAFPPLFPCAALPEFFSECREFYFFNKRLVRSYVHAKMEFPHFCRTSPFPDFDPAGKTFKSACCLDFAVFPFLEPCSSRGSFFPFFRRCQFGLYCPRKTVFPGSPPSASPPFPPSPAPKCFIFPEAPVPDAPVSPGRQVSGFPHPSACKFFCVQAQGSYVSRFTLFSIVSHGILSFRTSFSGPH